SFGRHKSLPRSVFAEAGPPCLVQMQIQGRCGAGSTTWRLVLVWPSVSVAGPRREQLMSFFDRWGVSPIINATGSVTRLGGAPMPAAVLEAYCAAAAEAVPLDVLQGAASRLIAEITGAEAGIVTCGAAAGLTLGAAAILTGYDLGRME